MPVSFLAIPGSLASHEQSCGERDKSVSESEQREQMRTPKPRIALRAFRCYWQREFRMSMSTSSESTASALVSLASQTSCPRPSAPVAVLKSHCLLLACPHLMESRRHSRRKGQVPSRSMRRPLRLASRSRAAKKVHSINEAARDASARKGARQSGGRQKAKGAAHLLDDLLTRVLRHSDLVEHKYSGGVD